MKFQGILAKPSDFIGNILKAGGHQIELDWKISSVLGLSVRGKGERESSKFFLDRRSGKNLLTEKGSGFSDISSPKSFDGTLKNRRCQDKVRWPLLKPGPENG